ncbi:MAG: hypothetical protein AB8B83_07330 [Bdellovibrionales bacterium]
MTPKKIVFAVVVLIVCGLIVRNLFDVPLNPQAEAFFAPDPFVADNNFFVHVAGMHAPVHSTDLYAYGLDRVRQDSEGSNFDELRFQNRDLDWKQFCFLQDDFRMRNHCHKAGDLDRVLKDEMILLNRYRDIYRKQGLVVSVGDKLGVPGTYGQDLISLHRLLVLQWIKMAKNGQAYDSINEWIASMQSIQHIINGKITIVEHAIWMIIYGLNLDVLPVVLSQDLNVLEEHYDAIEQILNVDYMAQWNLEDMEKAEVNAVNIMYSYAEYDNHFFFKINDTKNKFYAMWQDRIQLARSGYVALDDEAIEAFKFEHDPCYGRIGFKCLSYNYIANLVIGGMMKGVELFRNGYIMNARQRALLILLKAKKAGVQPDQMVDFISKLDPEFYNPLTEKPFLWDDSVDGIYYTIMHVEEPYQKRVVYYL